MGTRNRVARGYLGIAPETVWSILTEDLPDLQARLRDLLLKLSAANG